MNSIKESIWGMAGTKLVCAVLSLPVPSRSSNPIILELIEQRSERTLQKILLVGCNGSGASTIFKQVFDKQRYSERVVNESLLLN
ncbi:extra-large guanine nucleotide-binding protein 1-like [Rosa chinensis]|uniref:extra-large guanine nucleotide-binding protein 1-like n=1 Tax=Rosa chinensis TaxID=74649 RepID=UPI000D08AB3B|nr:extra-large guanine nucleotide-binding protein 1 isoform X2 [Rosa chinensis]XP_024177039.1 extra-large guanine nucleotide-binding protein 1-like [Rosa chinensis]